MPNINHMTEGMKRNLKEQIFTAVQNMGLLISNPEDIRSRRDFNRYVEAYNSIYDQAMISHDIVIETFIAIRPFPVIKKPVNTYIQQILLNAGQDKLIKSYGLEAFSMHVQDMRRTFIDKVFALCDYYLEDDISHHSRHIYDIYQMISKLPMDDEFKNLIRDVRNVRKELKKCPSAQNNIDITTVLRDIIDKAVYEKDYNIITKKLLFKPISYTEAIGGLNELIQKSTFS